MQTMHAASFTCCLLLCAWMLSCDGFFLENNKNFMILKDVAANQGEGMKEKNTGCEYLDLKDVKFLENGSMLILSLNITMTLTRTYIIVNNTRICFNRSDELKREILLECDMWLYEKDEFKILENGSVILFSIVPVILEPGTYEIAENELYTCVNDDDSDENSNSSMTYRSASAVLGRIGSSISVVAIIVHLIIFCAVPPLRNLPGYNLASLSIAFLIAYSSVIIGQIPSVLGLSCIISGVLQLNCFLVAFFCMNVMAFDVWRTLRLATSKLAVTSNNKKKIQFIIYTLYSWGVPLIITVTVVILDNLGGVPSWIKPRIGDKMICWITNNQVKIIFFSVPAFILFMVNGVFFVLSAVIIKNNTMQNFNDQHNQTVRLNFVLYVRLGLMMGITWLFSVLAILTDSSILWLISDFLNPLQGLFIFILFTCSPKVHKYVKQRVKAQRTPKTSTTEKKSCSSSDKNTTSSSTATTFSSPGHHMMTPLK